MKLAGIRPRSACENLRPCKSCWGLLNRVAPSGKYVSVLTLNSPVRGEGASKGAPLISMAKRRLELTKWRVAEARRAYKKSGEVLLREDVCDICTCCGGKAPYGEYISWRSLITCLDSKSGYMCPAHQRSLGLIW